MVSLYSLLLKDAVEVRIMHEPKVSALCNRDSIRVQAFKDFDSAKSAKYYLELCLCQSSGLIMLSMSAPGSCYVFIPSWQLTFRGGSRI